ncbi:alpha/beta hydrolase [Asticcacaulis sp. 201]|uniref:alpha/beta hydrolase n=1 Tax=Asticcacaulis sp. 201 TaxID=3028787 RepID=UPI00291613AD|nr:alpha/beta hydrolase [Asticcacaulis sp. 201]MDV6330634.1 alpha/beta hydrolase [Asticcacaulis sp. 201]
MLNRRFLMTVGAAAAALPSVTLAQSSTSTITVHDLWPGNPPGGEAVTATEETVLRSADPNDTAFLHVRKPWLAIRRPAKPNGAAMLIVPGGGYVRVAVSKAGGDIDAWLADQGVTTFTLCYRLPADGWTAGPEVALQDAQRAMRLIRSRSGELGLDPNRVGVIGFSAGGHVTGLLATRATKQTYAPVDAVDSFDARPTVAAMMYPVVTMTEPYAHKGSLKQALGEAPTQAARDAASIELHVATDTPPTFIGGTTDDPVVPMQNAILMYQALKASKVASELHLWEGATHGFPVRKDGVVLPWVPTVFDFLQRHGLKG